MTHDLLLPAPRSLTERDDGLEFSALVLDAGEIGDNERGRDCRNAVTNRLGPWLSPGGDATVRLGRTRDLREQEYVLDAGGEGVELRARDRDGFFYGAQTLVQWIDLHRSRREGSESTRTRIPGLQVRDRPDFRVRGVLLDISRNKVPTMHTLLQLVDLFAALKYNQLQLYTEHTFAYPGHEAVWKNASPMTADEVRELDAYCRERSIELVPNQNSFGHLHRWLAHAPYRELSECPEGVEHPFGPDVEPFSLCPVDPASSELLRNLYEKLLPNFTSTNFHVGFDETFEIGQGRSKKAVEELGIAAVWSEFLSRVYGLARDHGRHLQIWADMLLKHPEILDSIPTDVTLCNWGYEAGHPFREECATLSTTGCDVYVCPGTSSWLSFAGRTSNAWANLAEAAAAGRATGAVGFLLTDWGDRGHLQPLAVSYPAIVAGAAFAWNGAAAKKVARQVWARLIDRWVLGEPESGLGEAILKLGEAYLSTGAHQKNGTALFHLLMTWRDDLCHDRYDGMTEAGLQKVGVVIRTVRDSLRKIRPSNEEASQARDELEWVADALELSVQIGTARLAQPDAAVAELDPTIKEAVSKKIEELAERRRSLWLARNRRGGLEDSLNNFTSLQRSLQ